MTWVKEVIHNFACIFCNSNWSIALRPGEQHIITNKELYCPWCGGKHIYIYDEHSVGAGQSSDRRITSKKENDSNSNRISKE